MSFSVVTTHDVEEVAVFLKKSVPTIYSDSKRRPESLPPRIKIPGSSRLLFANLHQWASGLILHPALDAPKLENRPQRKRGRPSNLEVKRRKAEETGCVK